MKRIVNTENIIPGFAGTDDPFAVNVHWDADWIGGDGEVVQYTLAVNVPSDTIVHISASDRYILYCDGNLAGRGPAAGGHNIWFYDSYTINAGEHNLLALVYSQGKYKAWSQVSFGNRFILCADLHNNLLATGRADWYAASRCDWSFRLCPSPQDGISRMGTSGRFVFNAQVPSKPPAPAQSLEPGYCYSPYGIKSGVPRLAPNRLPAMYEQEIPLDFSEKISPNTTFTRLITLGNYYCAYPIMQIKGGKGAKITIEFSEALYGDNSAEFRGIGDEYIADGSELILTPLWWISGRYIRITVKTYTEPLEICSFSIIETHYPLTYDHIDTTKFSPAEKIMLRTLEMCMHETYIDCPHYEQLMYIGDTRIQMLIGYSISSDTRLAKQAITLLASSAGLTEGDLPCCYPSTYSRVIPGFSLYFTSILYDYIKHTGNREFVKPYLATARTILNKYLPQSSAELAKTPAGWNFYDWTDDWQSGIPSEYDGICFEFNAHLVYTLMLWAQVEREFCEAELASRYERYANGISAVLAEKNFIASEHYLCFMLLSGTLDVQTQQRYLDELRSGGGSSLSVYFSHYLFEVYRKFGLYEELDNSLKKWDTLVHDGFYTVPEEFKPDARSDCHAWGAHPIYHKFMRKKEVKQWNL